MRPEPSLLSLTPCPRAGGIFAPHPAFLSRAPRDGGTQVFNKEYIRLDNKLSKDPVTGIWTCKGNASFRIHGLCIGRYYRVYAIIAPFPPKQSATEPELPVVWDGKSWPPPYLAYTEFHATKRAHVLRTKTDTPPYLDQDWGGPVLNPDWYLHESTPAISSYAIQDKYFQSAFGTYVHPATGIDTPFPAVEFASYCGPEGRYNTSQATEYFEAAEDSGYVPRGPRE